MSQSLKNAWSFPEEAQGSRCKYGVYEGLERYQLWTSGKLFNTLIRAEWQTQEEGLRYQAETLTKKLLKLPVAGMRLNASRKPNPVMWANRDGKRNTGNPLSNCNKNRKTVIEMLEQKQQSVDTDRRKTEERVGEP